MKYASQIRNKLINGLGWNSISLLYKQGWFAIVLLILGRMLTPDDFGIIGMTTVLIQFFIIFINLGFESSIIQAKEPREHQLSTLFWINIVIGFILLAIGILVSPFIGKFYSMPEIVPIFSVLTLIFVINSFGLVQRGFLLRELLFKKVSIIESVSITLSGIGSVFLAYKGFGYWSLVFQQIAISVFNVLGYWFLSTWRPSFTFNWIGAKKLIQFSINVFYFNILNFFTHNIDVIIIGKFIGSEQLGLYLMAHNIIVRPINQFLMIIRKTLFPVLSRLQNDLDQFRNIYLHTIKGLFTLIAPVLVLIPYLAYVSLGIILGEKWIPSIPFILILCISALRLILLSPVGIIFLATGNPQLQWKFSLFLEVPLTLLGMFIGYKISRDAFGLVLGYNIMAYIVMLPGFLLAFPLIRLSIRTFTKKLKQVTTSVGILSIVAISSYLIDIYLCPPKWILVTVYLIFGTIILILILIQSKELIRNNIAGIFRDRQI